eukprot:TRINITY_DN54699_c0_g1_i1.p2 TRINITY_DN54699_c0_g1~~TRINITY_DN54699_c0_g1_i1.p2  ORF type:complete len:112 (-),score=22.03 TRINITY_DN54699_c0_g1_i1:136-471(-)
MSLSQFVAQMRSCDCVGREGCECQEPLMLLDRNWRSDARLSVPWFAPEHNHSEPVVGIGPEGSGVSAHTGSARLLSVLKGQLQVALWPATQTLPVVERPMAMWMNLSLIHI